MRKLYLFVAFLCTALGFCQNPADRDPAFNMFSQPLGQYFVDAKVGKSAFASDGKIFLLKGDDQFIKLDNNLLDNSFNIQGTGFAATFGSVLLRDFLILPDGKILIGGNFTSYNGQNRKKLVRLFPNGDLDLSFNFTGNIGQDGVLQILRQADGKLLILGDTALLGSNFFDNLIRLNADGSVDASFATPLNFRWHKIALQPDGKILVAHNTQNDFYSDLNKVSRLNGDGTLDPTFATATFTLSSSWDPYIRKLCLQANGKILVGGTFNGCNATPSSDLARLNSDGSVDTSFSVGSGFTHSENFNGYRFDIIWDIIEQPDQKVLVSGHFSKYNGTNWQKVIRLNPNGSIDNAFAEPSGFVNINTVFSISLDQNLNILVSGDLGYDRKFDSYIVKLSPDGTKNASFDNICKGFFSNPVVTVKETAAGKLLIGGNFHTYNDTKCYGFTRLNADGSPDGTLTYGGLSGFEGTTNTNIRAIAERPDGKIYIAGAFTSYNGAVAKNIIRINSDGTRDMTFNANNGVDPLAANPGKIKDILVKPDGGLLVAGDFDYYNSTTVSGLLNLSATGSGSSYSESVVGNDVTSLKYQPDGKLLVGLSHAGSGNYSTGAIKRFNGFTLDNTFVLDPEVEQGSVLSFDLQADGKIVLQGEFTIGGAARSIVRIFENGILDPTLNFPLDSSTNRVLNFALMPDQKLVVNTVDESNFTTRLLRLNNNGSIDPTFEQEQTSMGGAFATKVASGKILLHGYMERYKGLPAYGLIRLMGESYYFLQGQNKLDANTNGCDANDALFSNMKYVVSGSSGNFDFVANTTGNYTIGMSAGAYTITPAFENPAYFTTSPPSVAVNFPTQVSPQLQNFCITPVGIHPDLEIVVLPITAARPGFDAKYQIIYKNKGNQVQSGTVNLNFNDNAIDFVTATPLSSAQTADNLSWNFTGLGPFETRKILVTMNLNSPAETPSIDAGAILSFIASVTSPATDDLPSDNTFNYNQTVVNSLDPNDKTCLEGAMISTAKVGDYVHYVIRFENNGSYAAQDITVKDVIDISKFDINTLIPTGGSGLFVTRIKGGNTVEFFFENINLPFADAENDGYVAFKIKTKSTLISGNSFSNSAAIYFDYNTPIITNTATTTVQSLKRLDFSKNVFVVYPNPVKDILKISNNDNLPVTSVSIFNMLGQVVVTIPNADATVSIDVSHFAPGNYIARFNSPEGSSSVKFIKQ